MKQKSFLVIVLSIVITVTSLLTYKILRKNTVTVQPADKTLIERRVERKGFEYSKYSKKRPEIQPEKFISNERDLLNGSINNILRQAPATSRARTEAVINASIKRFERDFLGSLVSLGAEEDGDAVIESFAIFARIDRGSKYFYELERKLEPEIGRDYAKQVSETLGKRELYGNFGNWDTYFKLNRKAGTVSFELISAEDGSSKYTGSSKITDKNLRNIFGDTM